MRKHCQFFSLFIVAICWALPALSEEIPEAELHRAGQFTLSAPGVPAKVYLQAAYDYGAEPKPDFVRAARKGELQWLTNKGEGVTYQVIVPKSYQPGEAHGVLVFISAGEGGKVPKQYHPLLEKYRLIGIGADKSGNKHDTLVRHGYAVHAVTMIDERYDVDHDRIYVSGGSGGGRVTSQVMIMNPGTFTGGIPMIGANACMKMQNADSKGNKFPDPGMWKNTDKKRLKQAAMEGRFVFMTGSKDYNKANVKAVFTGYRDAGFKNVLYIEQQGLGHSLPNAEHFEKALQFIDAPLAKAARKHYEDAKRKQQSGRLGDALLLFRKASLHGRDTDWHADAQAQTTALQGE